MPLVSEGFSLGGFKELIDRYSEILNPEEIKNAKKLIDTIKDRQRITNTFHFTDEEREKQYRNLENMLLHVLKRLEENKDEEKNLTVINVLADSSGLCFTRIGKAIRALYDGQEKLEQLGLKKRILDVLGDLRKNIVSSICSKDEFGNTAFQGVHAEKFFIKTVGKEIGYPEVSEEEEDVFEETGKEILGVSGLSAEEIKKHLLKRFYDEYTPRMILDYVSAYLDDQLTLKLQKKEEAQVTFEDLYDFLREFISKEQVEDLSEIIQMSDDYKSAKVDEEAVFNLLVHLRILNKETTP